MAVGARTATSLGLDGSAGQDPEGEGDDEEDEDEGEPEMHPVRLHPRATPVGHSSRRR